MSKVLTLFKRSMPKCPGCIAMEMALESEGIPFKVVDIAETPEAVEAFDITSLPTLFVEEGGMVVEEMRGIQSVEKIKEALGGI